MFNIYKKLNKINKITNIFNLIFIFSLIFTSSLAFSQNKNQTFTNADLMAACTQSKTDLAAVDNAVDKYAAGKSSADDLNSIINPLLKDWLTKFTNNPCDSRQYPTTNCPGPDSVPYNLLKITNSMIAIMNSLNTQVSQGSSKELIQTFFTAGKNTHLALCERVNKT